MISKSERIISFIIDSIRTGKYSAGQAIPSINSTSEKFGVARKTVVRAYDKLKSTGLIESRPKRGYFVINKKPSKKLKVLLIVHSFSGHWEMLYNSFRKQVSDFCEIEIFFHHYNIKVFELIINRNMFEYDLFVISSFNHSRIKSVIGRIPSYKVLIISRNDRLGDAYNSVIQDFFNGTYNALREANRNIKKYKKINLSYPEKGGHSDTLKMGFLKYCNDFKMPHCIVDSLSSIEINKNEIFLVISDNDLIHLLNVSKSRKWKLGKDVGVISFNETPLKQVIRDGIAVISCNFLMMAEEIAVFIKEQKTVKKVIPIEFINRNSI